jgi:Zn-dependent protease
MASLLCHEYGHVWMAQRKNIYVSHVVVHGFGAAALIANMKPKQELAIAFAGPAVSLCLGIFFLVLSYITSIFIMGIIGTMNILLGVFNLLPIYPTDGGRILYSILSKKLGVSKGINYAVGVACVLAGILGLIGIIYGAINLLVLSILLVVLSFHQRTQVLQCY